MDTRGLQARRCRRRGVAQPSGDPARRTRVWPHHCPHRTGSPSAAYRAGTQRPGTVRHAPVPAPGLEHRQLDCDAPVGHRPGFTQRAERRDSCAAESCRERSGVLHHANQGPLAGVRWCGGTAARGTGRHRGRMAPRRTGGAARGGDGSVLRGWATDARSRGRLAHRPQSRRDGNSRGAMKPASLPPIIQGGMGVAVSGWRLARAVSRRGQLGVVSGTCLDTVLVRRLQDGDRDGALRRAMDAFPMPGVAARALTRYFRPLGRAPDEPYQLLPLYRQSASKEREALTMLAAFSEVYLAKEGHQGLVGINLLTKVQRPNIATLYGAMLAGVNYVLMGAGIPREIPAVLDALAGHRSASLKLDAVGLPPGEAPEITLNPGDYWRDPPPLERPMFL